MRVDGQAPSEAEIDAFCDRLNDILADGGQIDRIQIYTVARRPAVESVSALTKPELDRIADQVALKVPRLVERFYGPEAI